MRQTPYRGIRYPISGEVVDPAAIQTLAQDVDQALVDDDQLRAEAFRRSSVNVYTTSTTSLAKGVASAISWANTNGSQNGANGIPGYANWWSAGSPTRLTAPGACLVYAVGTVQLNAGSSLGSGGYFELFFGKNGSGATPNIQLNKTQPLNNTGIWTISCTVQSLWVMAAGDYLELKAQWSGTPAGPFSTSTLNYAGLQVIAVP